MNGVYAKDNENIEKVLRKFKRVCDNSGVLSEVRNYLSYEKPSEKKRRKHKEAVRKMNRPERAYDRKRRSDY